ncbi:MAG: hypothetical protein M3384_08375, partial [Acidobacteriota bacterium]|nr:hypothetical protein [Acidobacteriota bacterium]
DAPGFDKAADDFLVWVKSTKGESSTYRRYKFACEVLNGHAIRSPVRKPQRRSNKAVCSSEK